MDLYCRLRVEGHPVTDVTVDVAPYSTVADVIAAIVTPLGVAPDTAELVADGRLVDAAALVATAGIVHGTELTVRPRSGVADRSSGRERWSMRLSSPDTSTRTIGLPQGRSMIGSDPNALVCLSGHGIALGHLVVDLDASGAVTITSGSPSIVAAGEPLPAGTSRRLTGPTDIDLGTGHHVSFEQLPDTRLGGVDRLGQLLVNRPPQPVAPFPPRRLPALPAPQPPQDPPPFGWAAALIPMVIGVLAAVLLSAPMFLVFALMGPAMVAGSWLEQRRRSRRRGGDSVESWTEQLAEVETSVDATIAELRTAMAAANPSVGDLRGSAALRSAQLWSQRPSVPGFGSVRVAVGDRRSDIDVSLPDRYAIDDDTLRERVEALRSRSVSVSDAAVTLNLFDAPSAALWGSDAYDVANAVLVSLAASLSPADVVFAAVTSERLSWMKWLPHLRSSESPLQGAHLRLDGGTDTVRSALELDEDRSGPHVLVVIDGAAVSDASLTAALCAAADRKGRRLSLLWVGASHLDAPAAALSVRCEGARVDIADVATGEHREGAAALCSGTEADETARLLAPLADATAAERSASIPTTVELVEVVGAASPNDLRARWARHTPGTLAAPVGVGADGPVVVDLVADGPHALVAGTSGAGKSELLQTWVSSIAAVYPPSEVTFLFIDYKGGSATEVFSDLPHTVGFVTDLDEAGAHRALVSLRAEVRRREHLQSGKAPDRDSWAAAGGDAPPSLVIVVDEFATLVREIPDFVDGIVDVAQRGRSLGLHLVLATQRPAGVVSESILANIGVRMCLRTLDPSDSSTVVGVPDAASIPQPLRGRAVLRRGSDVEFVQTGWATAPTRTADRHRVTLAVFNAPSATQGTGRDGAGAGSQVGDFAARCEAAAADMAPPRRPWREELPEVLTVGDVFAAGDTSALRGNPGRFAIIGALDDPAAQAQYPAIVDLEADGGLLCIGSGGSGKTTLLRTAAAAAAAAAPPSELQLVVADFSSQGLGPLRRLPHLLGWATGGDRESVTRVLSMLGAEITRRRRRLAAAEASSWSELTEARSRIWVLVDDLGAFRAEFDNIEYGRWVDELRRVAVDGRQVGVHLLATADRRAALPPGLTSAISARVVLRCADPDEYTVLGIPRTAQRSDLPGGRGWLGNVTCQVASLTGDPSGAAAATRIGEIAARSQARAEALWEPLPEQVGVAELPAPGPSMLAEPVAVGVADLTGAAVCVDLDDHITVAGPPRSGRSTALEVIAHAAAAKGRPLIVRSGRLSDALTAAGVPHQSLDAIAELPAAVAEVQRPLVILDDCDDLIDDFDAAPIETLARDSVATFAVAVDAAALSRAWSGWMTAVRRSRQLWWLLPEPALNLGVPTEVRAGVEMVPGRGLVSTRDGVTLTQAAHR